MAVSPLIWAISRGGSLVFTRPPCQSEKQGVVYYLVWQAATM